MSRLVPLIAFAAASILCEETPAPPLPGALESAAAATTTSARWAILEKLFTAPRESLSERDVAYALSLMNKDLLHSQELLSDASPVALAVTCGWFTGLYNRYAGFIYISREPDRDVLLPAFMAQYCLIKLNRLEQIDPGRIQPLVPLMLTFCMISWLNITPVEAAEIYVLLRHWAQDLESKGLAPSIALLLQVGEGPGFPGNAPAATTALFHELSAPVTSQISPLLPPGSRHLFSGQDPYAFHKGLPWLEPTGMVLENVQALGLDEKAAAGLLSKLEMLRNASTPQPSDKSDSSPAP
ncbi:MAG: hypothetical protein JW909_09450 [Planctomycetes bacterium]|nr:hypothetical protein [Planctomycetota bacterium]